MESEDEPEAEEVKVDLLGQLSVDLGGTEYTLRPSRQAISNIVNGIRRMRGVTGQFGIPQLLVECGSLCLNNDELGLCVAELMSAYAAHNPGAGADYKHAKPERCADLIHEAGPVPVMSRLAVIFSGVLSGGYTASGNPKAVGAKTMEPIPTAS